MEKVTAVAEPWNVELWEGVGPAIAELRALLSDPANLSRLPEQFSNPMEIDQLEMLEAELLNQGILPAGATTLSQHALHSASILRWRARRSGVSGDSVHFVMRVPQYLLMRAAEIEHELQIQPQPERKDDPDELLLLRSKTWGKGIDSRTRLLQDLTYLERFSGYLLGRFAEDVNRYQRGLSLILKIIGNTRSILSSVDEGFKIALPMDVREFTRQIKALR